MSYQGTLYRSRANRVLGGVAAGIANYLNTDTTLIRIIFVLLGFFGGGGVIIYLICWAAMPEEPVHFKNNFNMDQQNPNPDFNNGGQTPPPFPEPKNKNNGNLIAGSILIVLGAMFLIDRFVPRINFGDLWPMILVVAGVVMIFDSINKNKRNNQ